MLLFIGIQATGKSSFYRANFFNTHVRIAMDLLNTRHKEQLFINSCFATECSFVVDNTNCTQQERKKYIDQAHKNGYKVSGYYFQSRLKSALACNKKRIGKDFVPEIGIRGTFAKLELPDYKEGFDELFYVECDNSGGFVVKNWQKLNHMLLSSAYDSFTGIK
jgi:predicted kinase